MKYLRAFISRLQSSLVLSRRDSDLAEELNLHIEMLANEYARTGMNPQESRRQARLVQPERFPPTSSKPLRFALSEIPPQLPAKYGRRWPKSTPALLCSGSNRYPATWIAC
jgi:hypothetical protein